MTNPHYSIILPIRNEDESLPQLFTELEASLHGLTYEIIAVDDASGLSDHPGKWVALRAGIERAKGSVVITMDADLQDDPKEIPMLLKTLDEGYDIVSGWRKNRKDLLYKILISRLGNGLVSLMTRTRFYDLNSPLKVFRRSVLMSLPHEGSLLRFSLLFAHKLGYKTKEVAVVHRPRRFGTSKFGLIKYIRIIYDLILIHLLFSGSGRMNKPSGLRDSQ